MDYNHLRRLALCVLTLLAVWGLAAGRVGLASSPRQAATCKDTVKAALTQAFAACGQLARNRVCYGNVVAEALPKVGVTSFNFAAPGDVIPVADLASLKLGGFNRDTGQWGVALLNIQSNVAGANLGSGVTVIAFGDTELRDASAPGGVPMQAFYLRNGVGMPGCENVPADGLLVQSPKGNQRVTLVANGVEMRIGSTAFIAAQPRLAGDAGAAEGQSWLRIETLDGVVAVSADGKEVEVPAGAETGVPLEEGEDGFIAAGPPDDPDPIEREDFEAFPFDALPDPLDADDLEQQWDEWEADATPDPDQQPESDEPEATLAPDDDGGGDSDTGDSDTGGGDDGGGDSDGGGDDGGE
jgi:uncharacterized membrane protein YgcG